MLKCTATFSKDTALMICKSTSLTFPATPREPSPNTREFLHCEWYHYAELLDRGMERALFDPILQRKESSE